MSEPSGVIASPVASPVGVCVLPEPPPNAARAVSDASYVHEILAHAGLAYQPVDLDDLVAHLPGLKIVVTVGDADLPNATAKALREWVSRGGAWLSVGGTGGVPDLFGVELEAPAFSTFGGGRCALGEGYLRLDHPLHPLLSHLRIPLHFMNGAAVRVTRGQAIAGVLDVHQRNTHRAAIIETAPGQGHALLLAVDIPGTVVRIQQGTCVTRDGMPAPDGTAPVSDGVLKSDDGAVLDWHFDRQPVRGVPGFSAFLQPIADQWRELLLRAILYLAAESRVPVPLLWLYPRNRPAIAHLSHDTDGNDPEKARRLLGVLDDLGVRSTWCTIVPGYEASLTHAIQDAGHELAMHFDAMSEGTVFTEEEFDAQQRALTAHFGGHAPVTNKNHYLRWEGDTGFYEWCARRGIRLDQSKGASKTGEAGYNFGTCHPFFPRRPDGTLLDVLELPTPTQDLVIFAPPEILPPLLEATERHHGVLHLLFHPAHIATDGVEEALRRAVCRAQERGLEFFTARDIDAWERARRRVAWGGYTAQGGGARVTLTNTEHLQDATVLWLIPPPAPAAGIAPAPSGATVRIDGAPVETEAVERFGFRFAAAVFDAAPAARTIDFLPHH